MAIHLHRAARTDLLVEELASVLAVPASDPFATELVVVPAKGVERWLTQRLAHRLGAANGDDGVCAGVRFLSPNRLVTLLLGTDRDDPWLPDQLVWPVLAAIDDNLGMPWATQLAAHLGYGDESPQGRLRAGRRYAVARRLAGLFDAYAAQRPALLRSWEAAADVGPWEDGAGAPLDADLAWQPHVWRAVVDRVRLPTPVARHAQTVESLRTAPEAFDIPDRLSLFGHTRLASTEVELLAAVAEHRDVHLWLPHPSETLWAAMQSVVIDGPCARADDRSVLAVRHPLLASLGRDVRELQRTLALAGPMSEETIAEPAGGGPPDPATWLEWLQADLRADRVPTTAEAAQRGIPVGDRSIQVHGAHGPARQVEVLREVLLGLLADDPSLEPRDILVMCPDVDTFAPLIHADFGLGDLWIGDTPGSSLHPGHHLRVQLADRSKIFTNPLLAIAAQLVELAAGRITASEVLDLAATEPVRRRFGFDEDDLERFAAWTEQAAIRWGLDGRHRTEFQLDGLDANSWHAGLDRLLLGVTRAEDGTRSYPFVLPLDDVDSGSIELAGRVVEFVDRIAAFRDACTCAQSAAQWTAALRDGVRALTDVPFTDLWQQAEFERELAVIAGSASAITLSHSDIRTLLSTRLESRATRANFRTGSLTVCTMVPMRSVPHRVVALLGLDDGVFPRASTPDGDDVLARAPRTGERDARSEDRQLLLDAILAATDTLVVTYSAADPHTGAPRPPAVPLGELIDAARATAGLDPTGAIGAIGAIGADDADTRPVRRHRLQPFDTENLTPDAISGVPFSFDPQSVPAAQALRDGKALTASGAAPTSGLAVPGPLPMRDGDDLTVADLITFFANPTRAYLRERLDVASPLEEELRPDAIPVDLDGLQSWQIGERLLSDLLAGKASVEIERAELQRGSLPPAALGYRLLVDIGPRADAIAAATGRILTDSPVAARSVDIDVEIGGGRRLVGSVQRVHDRAFVLPTYSTLSGKHRLEAWITLLALTAGTPAGAGPWTAHAIGRRGKDSCVANVGPIAPDLARTFLLELVELRDLGLSMPLAFAPKTSYDYAARLHQLKGRKETLALAAAREQWEKRFDNNDPSIALLYGPNPPLDIWLGPPSADEVWEFAGEAESLPSRLGHTAMRVFRPALLAGVGT